MTSYILADGPSYVYASSHDQDVHCRAFSCLLSWRTFFSPFMNDNNRVEPHYLHFISGSTMLLISNVVIKLLRRPSSANNEKLDYRPKAVVMVCVCGVY